MVGARSIPARHGGLEKAVEELSVELAGRGHDVLAIADGAESAPTDHFRGVQVRAVRAVRTKHLHTPSQVALSMPVVRKLRPDLVHFHGVGPGIAAPIAKRLGFPVVLTVQGIDWRRDKWAGPAKTVFEALGRRALTSPDAVIAVSKEMRRALLEDFGRDSTYIPNGVRPPEVVPAGRVLEKLGVDPGSYLLFAARLVPEKGLHYLLEALNKLDGSVPLVVAGGGASSYSGSYEAEVRRRAGPRVFFTGHVHGAELRELFSHARAFVLPSVMEGLPLGLLEAMSFGLPCVHSAIPECEEVTEGSAGFSFPVRDSQALASVLNHVLSDEGAAREVGARARARVQTEYTWSSIADRTESLYRQVLG